MKTARGIYHNLSESEYTVQFGVFTFVFSSRVYREKFMDRLSDEVERFNDSINNIYKNKFAIDMAVLAIVRLYRHIETRGFLIYIEGVEITCPESLEFVLEIKISD